VQSPTDSRNATQPARSGDRSNRLATSTRARRVALSFAAALLLIGTGLESALAAPLDEPTEQLLVEAVEAAYALDLYHARCRSDGSNRRTENLNKLLASRMRMTVLRVQDDIFPERNYRRVQERLQSDFLEMLRERGGCAGVKDSDLPAELRARYDEKIRAIEALP
jgi:hypothetical protein